MDEREKDSDNEEEKNENVLVSEKDQIPKTEEEIPKEDNFNKEKIIAEIMKSSKERENLLRKNESLQRKLFMFIKGSAEKEYFQTLELPLNANADAYQAILRQMNDKRDQIEKEQLEAAAKRASLEQKISEEEDAWKELNQSFVELKTRIALQSVNTDSGERYTKEEVDELLRREEEMRKNLEDSQLQSIRKKRLLEELMDEKKNLVEGPLDFGEFEIMCTGTENNIEVVKQLKEEVKNYVKKASDVVNTLNHMKQKIHSVQTRKVAAQEKEMALEEELTEMRKELFQEKMMYATMNQKNEELQHKSILLQHPKLVEDYKNLITEKEEGKKELVALKSTYKAVMKIVSKDGKKSHS
ncbi:hypothetical protein AVEN_241438-1 [Araneus ventricosus]|uniref:DUF4201 domain-containing protein n=1 Tax=Araneus ventricosus TaxID=182803 RepID=A0A4Y2FVY0_ARAVE|nr:hypothetical protein AVEN_241438-1 [Araneus ventricosus]